MVLCDLVCTLSSLQGALAGCYKIYFQNDDLRLIAFEHTISI